MPTLAPFTLSGLVVVLLNSGAYCTLHLAWRMGGDGEAQGGPVQCIQHGERAMQLKNGWIAEQLRAEIDRVRQC